MEKDKKLRIGIIGCGGIANGKHMPALYGLEDSVEMVAFCDIIEERAEQACDRFGTMDAKFYVDYKELLKDESIDVVHVCTPNRSHSFISIDALNAGKHVMCEKPMAKTYKEAKEMYEASVKAGKKLSIGYQNRQTPEALYSKSVCESGQLGEMYFARALAVRRRAVPTWGVFLNEYEQGGGPLIDIGTHALDLTLWMLDNYKPKMVVGNTFKKLGDQTDTANAWGDWDPKLFTVEDSAFGYVVMENGCVVTLDASWALNVADTPEAKFVIAGVEGGIDTIDGVRVNYVKHARQVIEKPNLDAGGVAFYEGIKDSPSNIEAARWINAILTDTPQCVLPEQAMVVTQILEGIYESAATGKPVYF